MDDPIQVTLHGEHGCITADAVQEALSQLLVLVTEAGKSIGTTSGSWMVNRLELGSAVIAISNPAAPGVVPLIDSGIDALREAAELPPLWTLKMVAAVRKMARLPGGRGVESVSLRAHEVERELDARIAMQADTALMTKEESLGNVRGRLDTWSVRRGTPQVGMTLDDGGSLQVHYPESQAARVMSLLNHDVEAWGLVERNAAGQRLRLKLEGLDVAPPKPRLVPVHEVSGIYAALWPGNTAAEVLGETRT